jgi:hypothetical protein
MVLSLSLALCVVSISDFAPSARLLVAGAQPSSGADGKRLRLLEIEETLARPPDGWGAGHATAAVVGFILGPVGAILGPTMLVVGVNQNDAGLAIAGSAVTAVGVGLFILAIWAVGAGTSYMNADKDRRFKLYREKEALETGLQMQEAPTGPPPPPPPSVMLLPQVIYG